MTPLKVGSALWGPQAAGTLTALATQKPQVTQPSKAVLVLPLVTEDELVTPEIDTPWPPPSCPLGTALLETGHSKGCVSFDAFHHANPFPNPPS